MLTESLSMQFGAAVLFESSEVILMQPAWHRIAGQSYVDDEGMDG